ncbi:MAG: ABC transporter substrate-binding protein [Clostridiales bacterium]|nr:ABC transporter substrate-binding protein [Clostridiales bacterium]
MKIKINSILLLLLLAMFISSCNNDGKEEETNNIASRILVDQLDDQAIVYLNHFLKEDTYMLDLYSRYKALLNPYNRKYDSIATSGYTTRLIDYPSFMDASGFITTFKEKPKNVAVLFSSYAEIWQLAGGTVNITVKETVDRKLVEMNDVSIVGAGSGKEINYEQLLSLRPDLVILTADYEAQMQLADRLRMFQIPVLVLRVDSFLDYLKALSMFTTILDTKNYYREYGNTVLGQVEAVVERTQNTEKKPTVLFLRAYSYGAKVKTTNHFVGQMLKDLGAINIAESKGFPLETLSQEVIASSNVDYIFISVMGEDEGAVRNYVQRELLAQPAFSSLTAVKEKKYYILPKDLFTFKPNARWGEAYLYLAKLLYPDTEFDSIMNEIQ